MDKKEHYIEFGEKLRKVRESQNISLERIFEITRNDLKYLQAIEKGDFDIMPEVYMKALLKEYAEVIGLNPDEVVEEFMLVKENKTESEKNTGETVGDQNGEEKIQKRVFEETALGLNAEPEEILKKNVLNSNKTVVIGAAAVLVLIIAYLIFKPEEPKVIIKETPYKEIIKSGTEEKPEKLQENKSGSNPNGNFAAVGKPNRRLGELTLVIAGTDTSWVRITADGKLQGEFLIYPGVTKSFGATKYFTVLAGNSGGIQLTLNDSSLVFNGKKGRVRNLYIDKDGVKYLRISKKKKNE